MCDVTVSADAKTSTTSWSSSASTQDAAPSALAGLRVLDLSGLAGQYCGKQFADLGADVILIEPVMGSPVRRDGPFVDDRAHIEFSLPFAYFNAGKRGIAIDLDRPEGQRILRQLADGTDLIVETEKPGTMNARSLDHAALSVRNPRLVMTSITPFGQTGPYAKYEAEDIVALATRRAAISGRLSGHLPHRCLWQSSLPGRSTIRVRSVHDSAAFGGHWSRTCGSACRRVHPGMRHHGLGDSGSVLRSRKDRP